MLRGLWGLVLASLCFAACADVWGFHDLAGGDGGASAEGGQLDALTATDGAVTVDVVDGGAVVDTGTSDASDGGAVVDTGTSDASDGGPGLSDAAEAGCEPIPPVTYACSAFQIANDITCGYYTTPGQFPLDENYALTYTNETTPAVCQCAGAYTCACLQSSAFVPPSAWCTSQEKEGGTGSGCECMDTAQGPIVFCGTPC
jgi:hypothetical protein